MGKKISKSQKSGKRGENYFRIFADKHDLIESAVDGGRDFGIDFFCQYHDKITGKSARVHQALIGVSVKSSIDNPATNYLDHPSISALLSATFPVLVVLVENTNGSVRYRFLDLEFQKELYAFQKSTEPNQKYKLNTSSTKSDVEVEFRESLVKVSSVNYQSKLSHQHATLRLGEIGRFNLTIQTNEDGTHAVVLTNELQNILKRDDSITQHLRHMALIKGDPNLPMFPVDWVNTEVFSIIEKMADSMTIKVPIFPNAVDVLGVRSVSGEEAWLSIERRKFGTEFGLHHESGLTLIFDSNLDKNGAHSVSVTFDDPDAKPFFDCPDLLRWLDLCGEKENQLILSKTTPGIELEVFPVLLALSIQVKALCALYEKMEKTIRVIKLPDLYATSFGPSLGFFGYLFTSEKNELLPGVAHCNEQVKIDWKAGHSYVPIEVQIPEGVFCVNIYVEGELGYDASRTNEPSDVVAFKFNKFIEIEDVVRLGDASSQSFYPRIIITKNKKLELAADGPKFIDEKSNFFLQFSPQDV